jgi:16S rRNA C1402 N4-methylase RsmH
LTPKGIKADEEEIKQNTRAKSATLRVAKKISELN